MDVVDVGARGSTVVGDDDSLTRGQAVVLHDEARTETVQGPLNLRIRRTRLQGLRRGGSDPGARHDVLRESLGPLDLSRSLGRAEDRESCIPQFVTHARDQRDLRADHDQIHPELLGQAHRIRVIRVERGDGLHPRVAGADVDLRDGLITGQGISQCVLAGTAAKYKNAHSVPV